MKNRLSIFSVTKNRCNTLAVTAKKKAWNPWFKTVHLSKPEIDGGSAMNSNSGGGSLGAGGSCSF